MRCGTHAHSGELGWLGMTCLQSSSLFTDPGWASCWTVGYCLVLLGTLQVPSSSRSTWQELSPCVWNGRDLFPLSPPTLISPGFHAPWNSPIGCTPSNTNNGSPRHLNHLMYQSSVLTLGQMQGCGGGSLELILIGVGCLLSHLLWLILPVSRLSRECRPCAAV